MENTIKIKGMFDKLKDGVLRVMSASVINQIISMLSSMIVTRILTQADYGIWSYVLNFYAYLGLITGFGLISGALQFGTENKGEERAYQFFRYCIDNGLLVNTVIVIVTGIVLLFVQLPITSAKPYVIAILPLLLVQFIYSIGQSILRSQNKIKEYSRSLNINSIATAVGTCGGALFGVSGMMIGRYAACIVSIIYEMRILSDDLLFIRKADRLLKKDIQDLWHFSIFTGASSAMNCLVYLLDITVIAAVLKDANTIGIYRVGTLIPNALQFIPSSVVIAILPTIIYHRQDQNWVRVNIKKAYIGLAVCNTVICSIIILGASLIIKIVSGPKYLPSVPVLRVLTLGYFISGTFRSLSVNFLAAFRHVHFGLFISIMSGLTDIVFNILFIQWFGMIGAAYATLMVDIVAAGLSFSYVILLMRKGIMNIKIE